MNEQSMKPFWEAIGRPFHRYVKEAKSNGNKVVGFFCSYVPLELLDAAGVLPYRIKGVSERDIGTGTIYLSTRLCTFSRNALTLALEDDLSFVDGFVGTNTCDQIRRTSQNWVIKNPPEFSYFIHTPRAYNADNISHYQGGLTQLKSKLEAWLERQITDDDLREASNKRNRSRFLLRQLSDLRKQEDLPLSGSEMLTVSVAYHQMPVEQFIQAAEELLKERTVSNGKKGEARVILAGGPIDDPSYVSFIEEQGLDVVADPVCFGLRCYWDDVDVEKPPFQAIAERALTHFPCARMGESFPRRWEDIERIYDDYKADGIIYQRLKFCQLWGVDTHNMNPLCEKRNIPLLHLEREYGIISTGQLKTRLQAFTELIEAKKAMKI